MKLVCSINQVDRISWNALKGSHYPFLKHEFLSALENNNCLGLKTGWLPRYLIFFDQRGAMIAGIPMYEKNNSFGEFVFDWGWADAYQRAGLPYYPKLVVASPFTPANGPRVLISPEYTGKRLFQQVIEKTIFYAEKGGFSSIHWLFSTEGEARNAPDLLLRTGFQFHWENQSYGSFDEFLARMSSKKRKQIKRERRRTRETGVTIKLLKGRQLDLDEWRIVHQLYVSTFARHGNYPALTLNFFTDIADTMGDQILVALAYRCRKITAASFFLLGNNTLYGRYWGCFEDIPGLHFEACYYQGLEYCIEQGIQRFEPGAQGEHKISRGFLPTKTRSLHWIGHPGFRQAIADFLVEENRHIDGYINSLMRHSPYKKV